MKEFTIFDRPFRFLMEESQWIKLQNYLEQYLFENVWSQYAMLLLLILFLGFLLTFVLRGTPKKVMNHLLLMGYLVVLALLFVAGRGTARGIRVFNVNDYLTDTGFHETRVLIAVINCLMFVPLGIALRKASGRAHAITNSLLIFLVAAGIEIAQYLLARGFSALEDVLMYVLGGFAGLIIAAPFCLLSEYMEEKGKM
ncbi:MAG: VanZ family protein [Lachnospiraceae bacterium]|nr:VanZ family protein [Lachnospiraceae bacterium]